MQLRRVAEVQPAVHSLHYTGCSTQPAVHSLQYTGKLATLTPSYTLGYSHPQQLALLFVEMLIISLCSRDAASSQATCNSTKQLWNDGSIILL